MKDRQKDTEYFDMEYIQFLAGVHVTTLNCQRISGQFESVPLEVIRKDFE